MITVLPPGCTKICNVLLIMYLLLVATSYTLQYHTILCIRSKDNDVYFFYFFISLKSNIDKVRLQELCYCYIISKTIR